jgi:hypothetical protein
MQELRLVAVSEDGSYAVLVVPGRSGRFALPIDERLRTVARGQFSRLAQYEIEVESPLRPKEIQDRIRAGETAEDIADAAGLPVDRIRRFEGPVLAERAFRAQEARKATVRSQAGPGPRLGEIVSERLSDAGANLDEVDWDSRKRQDGNWQVQLAYTLAGRMYVAEWVYDPRSKHVIPHDDEAMRLSLGEDEWPEPRQPGRPAATATVTPIGSRSDRADHPSDKTAGNAMMHPSRQAPTGASSAGLPRPARLTAQAGDAVQSGAVRNASLAAGRGRPEPGFAGHPDGPPVAGAAGRDAAEARAESGREDLGLAAGTRQEEDKPAAAEARPSKSARRSSGGRSRRSSVPSWDEIMFGNSRQPE